jgi:hypothetical protein
VSAGVDETVSEGGGEAIGGRRREAHGREGGGQDGGHGVEGGDCWRSGIPSDVGAQAAGLSARAGQALEGILAALARLARGDEVGELLERVRHSAFGNGEGLGMGAQERREVDAAALEIIFGGQFARRADPRRPSFRPPFDGTQRDARAGEESTSRTAWQKQIQPAGESMASAGIASAPSIQAFRSSQRSDRAVLAYCSLGLSRLQTLSGVRKSWTRRSRCCWPLKQHHQRLTKTGDSVHGRGAPDRRESIPSTMR